MDCKNRIIKLRESIGLNRKDFCKLVHIPYDYDRVGIGQPPCTGLCAVAFGVLYPQRGTYGKRKE